MFPAPLAAKPMPGVLLTQLKTLPVPVKLTAAVAAPLLTVWLPGTFTPTNALTTPGYRHILSSCP